MSRIITVYGDASRTQLAEIARDAIAGLEFSRVTEDEISGIAGGIRYSVLGNEGCGPSLPDEPPVDRFPFVIDVEILRSQQTLTDDDQRAAARRLFGAMEAAGIDAMILENSQHLLAETSPRKR